MPFRLGSFPLFRLFGVQVFIHWSWGAVALFQIYRNNARGMQAGHTHQPLAFYVAEYLCLFLIVLIHEFGHALACKSVGGTAEKIVLWPLGGVAYVQPPQRAGALFWSIVAGPLVNVIFLPLTIGPLFILRTMSASHSLAFDFLSELALINVILLVFNLLPIYPLDGGQILRALLWFVVGRGRSLLIAAVIGMVGAIGLAAVAMLIHDAWLGVIILFMSMGSWNAIKIGKAQMAIEKSARHLDARCPDCRQHPPVGQFWKCACGTHFDTFAADASCPGCAKVFTATTCPLCAKSSPRPLWYSTGGFTVAPLPAFPPVIASSEVG